jgi:hypothetical protein
MATTAVYFCEPAKPESAFQCITSFYPEVFDCSVDEATNTVVARARVPVDQNVLTDLITENCILKPASPVAIKSMEEDTIRMMLKNASVDGSWLLCVHAEHAWTRTAEQALRINQVIADATVIEQRTATVGEAAGATAGDADQPAEVEYIVTFKSEPIEGLTAELPPEVAKDAQEKMFTKKDAHAFDFIGRVIVEVTGIILLVQGYFSTEHGAMNFVAKMQTGGAHTMAGLGKLRAKFMTANIMCEARRIDQIDDIISGLSDGEQCRLDPRIQGSVRQLLGPTQAGKSTTTASMIGRHLQTAATVHGGLVIEGVNPLTDPALAEKYAAVKRTDSATAALDENIVVPFAEVRGLAMPPDFSLIRIGDVASIPPGYIRVPLDQVPDMLAVAKDQLGSSTTKDVHVYVTVIDTKTLDSPGTHDTSGIRIDTRNAVIRKRVADLCEDGVKICITMDFSLFQIAAAAEIEHFIAPLACMFKDFEGQIENVTVLLTKISKPSQLKAQENWTPDRHLTTVQGWVGEALGHIRGLVITANNNGRNASNQFATKFMNHVVTQLTITQRALLNNDMNAMGRATVVHPFAPPERYLLPAVEAAALIPSTALRASLGPLGSGTLGRCLDRQRQAFDRELRRGHEAQAFTIAGRMFEALHRLDNAPNPVHYTDDAKVKPIVTEMANLLQAERAKNVATLEAAVSAGNVEQANEAIRQLLSSDAAVKRGLHDVEAAVAERAISALLGNRPDAETIARDTCERLISTSTPSTIIEKELTDAGSNHFAKLRELAPLLQRLAQLCRTCTRPASGAPIAGASFIRATMDKLLAIFEVGCTDVASYANTAQLNIDEVELRTLVERLTAASIAMYALVGHAQDFELSQTAADVVARRESTLRDVLISGLLTLRDSMCKVFADASLSSTSVGGKVKYDPALFERAARKLHAIGSDQTICAALAETLRKCGHADVSLLTLLYAPFTEAISALRKDPLERTTDMDPMSLATAVRQSVRAKLQALKIFSGVQEDETQAAVHALGMKVVENAQATLVKFKTLAKQESAEDHRVAMLTDEQSDGSASSGSSSTSKASSDDDVSAPRRNRRQPSPARDALHCIVALALIASEFITAFGDATVKQSVFQVFKEALKCMRELVLNSTRAARVAWLNGNGTLQGYVAARSYLLRLEHRKPMKEIYQCELQVMADLLKDHTAGLQEVKVQRVQVTSDLQAHVSAMHLAADTTTLPYDRVSHWLQKLDEIDLQICLRCSKASRQRRSCPPSRHLRLSSRSALSWRTA